MAYYTGDKPCPGCGRKACDAPRRRAAEICCDCSKLLKLGKEVRENGDGFSRLQLAKYSMGSLFVTDLSEAGYENQKRHFGLAYVSDYGSNYGRQGSSKHLIECLENLAKTLDEGAKENYEFKISMEESFPAVYSIRTPVVLAIVELLEAFRIYGERREAEGYENGQKLLLRLCDGSITIDDFNKRSVGETKKT